MPSVVNREWAKGYIAAMIDGEGHVCTADYTKPGETSSKHVSRVVGITNTDMSIVSTCRECLDMLGIPYTVQKADRTKYGHKNIYEVSIASRKGIEGLCRHVHLGSKVKRQKLYRALVSYRRKQPPCREWLVQKYWVEELNLRDIRDMLGVSLFLVQRWMRLRNVPRRKKWEVMARG